MNPDYPDTPPITPPRQNFPAVTLVVIGLVVLMFMTAMWLLTWVYFVKKPENLKKQGSSRLMIVGTVPNFDLQDRGGQRISAESLKGKVWVADFFFTSCAGPCRIMSENMSQLEQRVQMMRGMESEVRFVSVSVDPERDTTDVLSRYADQFRADKDRWKFLTGNYDDIQKLAKEGFKLGISKANPAENEPIIHSQSFILVDRLGRIRGYYDGTNASEVEKLTRDIVNLAKEDFRS